MRAVDTNVVARALMRDDPIQTPMADDILSQGAFVPLTVFLESAWLLRSRYGLTRPALVEALRALIDMPNVTLEVADGLEWVLDRIAKTGDIADMIHIVAARGTEAFVTFDGDIEKTAGPDSPVPIEALA